MIREFVTTFRAKGLVAMAAVALAGRADPQQARAPRAQPSDAFDRACVDLINGKTPKGAEAIEALRNACAELMKARTEQNRRADLARQAQAKLKEEARLDAQAGRSTAPVQPGGSVPAAFAQAGNELVGSRPRGMMGMRRNGEPFSSTVVTNPIGWFTGLGVNVDYARPFEAPIFSWTAGAHYSQSAATDRTLYTLGFLGGVDWFIIGRNNDGLRIGPRLDYSFGRESSTGTETRSRLGLAGEVGYNFIATNGITGEAAFGLGGRVAGDKNEQLSSGAGGEFGPYVKLGLGFSW